MLALFALALAGVAVAQETPAPTFTGHDELFEKIQQEENETRHL